MASAPGKNRPDMPGRIRQATLIFLGPDEEWRKWCARALAVNRLHPLVCPQRPKVPSKPGAIAAKPDPKTLVETDPWPYPLMTVPAGQARQRLLAMETATVIAQDGDDRDSIRELLDLLISALGGSRVSMAVVCDSRESPWLKDELLGSFPVTITVLCRRGDSLTLLRRTRRSADESHRGGRRSR